MKKSKKILLTMLASLTMLGALVACSGEEGPGPQFLEGAQTRFELTDTVILADIVDFVTDSEYTITISKGDFSVDVTNKVFWAPLEPGEYTITYTVEEGVYEGTNTFIFVVRAPKLDWKYTIPTDIYDVGQTLVFDEYFHKFNSYVESWYGYNIVMDSVTFNDQTIEFTNETSYTFTDSVKHLFKFHVETEDGQSISAQSEIGIRYINAETKQWLADNNMTVYNELRLNDDKSIVLGESTHSGTETQQPVRAMKYDMSYIAYNGDYGLNDYLVVDFTGNNMPYIVFFNGEVSNSCWHQPAYTDAQNKGITLSNGWTTKKGVPFPQWETSINNMVQLNGPNKTVYADYDEKGTFRKTVMGASPASMTALINGDNDQYRLIVGYTNGTTDGVTVEMYLYNLTTGAVMYNGGRTLENLSQTDGVTFGEDYFHGNIVLYGQFGLETKVDKLYPIVEDTTIEAVRAEYCRASSFKQNAKQGAELNEQLSVADYIDPAAGANYWLKLTDPDGNVTDITGEETFTVSKIGTYTLSYNDGTYATAALRISVQEIDPAMKAWMQANNVTAFMAQNINADGSVVLSKSVHSGSATAWPSYEQVHDMSYIAYNGNYGVNDFVVIDFTGNNMPYITFFAEEITGSAYYNPNATDVQNRGVVINNGPIKANGERVTAYDNTYNKRLMAYPQKIVYTDGGGNYGRGPTSIFGEGDHVGVVTLNDSTDKFRLIVGITEYSANKIVVSAYAYNITKKAVVQQNTVTLTGNFNVSPSLSGSIVLYGMIGKQTTIDKLYAIEQDAQMADLIDKYVPASKFKEGVKTTLAKGETLNVADYIQTVAGATYTLSYIYNDVETPITGETFSFTEYGKYTLVYNDGENLMNTLTIMVENIDMAFATWMQQNNVSIYNSVSANGSAITLKASTHNSTNVATSMTGGNTTHDMSYLAYNGNYQAGDFLVVDFTGDNMPYINFFAGEVTNSIFYSASASAAQNKGITYTHGFRNQATGDILTAIPYNRPQLIGVSKIYKPFEDAQPCDFRSNVLTQVVASGDMAPIGMQYMSGRYANTRMRMIIGFSETSNANASFTFNVVLINLDTGEIICNGGRIISGKSALSTFDFSGSIVMYAPHGKDLVLDNVYAIEEDTTIDALIAKYLPQA